MVDDDRLPPPELARARETFLELVAELRPELHRYCARLTGSIIDGEDVVQDTLAKAYYSISMATEVPPLRPLLFRIAHNAALDRLRRYEHRFVESVAEIPDRPQTDDSPDPETVRAALTTFLELPVTQRSAVILKDVLGCSLEEIVETTGSTLPAVKAALVRGRQSLRARHAAHAPERPRAVDRTDRARLGRYATLFNARDWEGLRELIAEDCRLDLVSRAERRGAGVGEYFSRYSERHDVRAVPGTLDGTPVLGMHSPPDAATPSYFVILEWRDAALTLIRDFRYVPYIGDELAQGRATFEPDPDA